MQHDKFIYDCQRHPLIPKRNRIHDCPKCGGIMGLNEIKFGFWHCYSCGFEITHEENGLLFEKEKETPIMNALKVEYNGFTGELVKLERKTMMAVEDTAVINAVYQPHKVVTRYDLSIYDAERKVTHTFDGVKLEDIKFLGGAVSFG